jgi:hypothetical protein
MRPKLTKAQTKKLDILKASWAKTMRVFCYDEACSLDIPSSCVLKFKNCNKCGCSMNLWHESTTGMIIIKTNCTVAWTQNQMRLWCNGDAEVKFPKRIRCKNCQRISLLRGFKPVDV